jgi:PAS domain S-box-containing protein
MASAAAWSLSYALFLSADNLQEKIFWQSIRFIFLPFLPVFELWLVLAFLKRDTWIAGWRLGILCIIPSANVILALTSQYHTLFKYQYEIVESGGFLTLSASYGSFYTIYLLYSYILNFTALMFVLFIHDTAHKIYKKQQVLLCLALFIPVIPSFMFDIGITPIPGVNPTPAILWIMGILYGIALFRYRLFDVIPIARAKVIDEMGMPMIVLNNEGRIIDINPAADHLLGHHGQRTVGLSLSDLAHDWEELVQFAQSTNQGRKEITRLLDGIVRTYEARIDTLDSEPAISEGKVLLLTDITLQKTLENELREGERRWKSIVDGAPFPIVITRVSDNTILLVNKKMVEQFNTPEQDLLGNMTEKFYVDPEERRKFIDEIHIKGAIDDILLEMKSLDDRRFWVYASVRKTTYQDEDAYFISFADITQRVHLEDRLKEKNKDLELISHTLQETNNKLNLLSSITRHDILNQVHAIILVTEQLKETCTETDDEMNIDIISKSGKHIQDLIEFTAEYQTLGQTGPRWQSIRNIIAGQVVESLLSGINLEILFQDIEIFADPLLSKVFYNLVDNSIRHGISVKTIRLSMQMKEKNLLVIYEDDGIGIADDEKEKVFSRWYGKNTGLGLFLIREILDITGMKITECGVSGKGVRFEIEVPSGKYRLKENSY